MEVPFFFKRVIRSWKMFLALLLGIILASTFFCSMNLGADTIAKEILDEQLSQIAVDIVVYIYYPLSASNLTEVMDAFSIPNIKGVTHIEPLSKFEKYSRIPRSNETARFRVVGITEGSIVYEGLNVRSGNASLKANETYVWADSPSAGALRLGDTICFNMTWEVWTHGEPSEEKRLTLNLTVAGFVDLEDQALRTAAGRYWAARSSQSAMSEQYRIREDILIVDPNKTLANVMGATNTDILVFLDRDSLINFWDIGGSIDKIWTTDAQIQNRVYPIIEWGPLNPSPENYIRTTLSRFNSISQSMRNQFLMVSLPVFFVAWYLGSTVSDVSYNLRRREIGLLLTKGYSRSQLLRMFLSETTLIGLVGGLTGVGLSVFLTPIFLGVGDLLVSMPFVHMDTIAIVLAFSVGLTLLSVFQSARRSSKLDIVEALQEYRYVEEVKPYRMRWPWVAFILGTYKIVTWLWGINLQTWLYYGPPPGLGVLLIILLGVWTFFDIYVLNYIGPLLFFWGFTKIFLGSSLMFQELATRTIKFMGDLGALATKNLRRNPVRTASIAFLIAMIIGYSFQAVGSYTSERDYILRQVKFDVGADISVQLSSTANASSTMGIIGTLPGVSYVTIEYRFEGFTPLHAPPTTLVAIDPSEWPQTAHYEGDLFTGGVAFSAFREMENDNETIILEWGIAETLKLRLGDYIAVQAVGEYSKTINLRVVGLFGPKTSTQEYRSPYWSYVPQGLYETMKDEVYSWGKILVKLEPNADGKAVAEEIRNFQLEDISAVSSVSEILEWQQDRWSPYTPSISSSHSTAIAGSIEIQRLGVIFAVLAASLGTALVTLVSLKERSREVGILGARGLSFNQMVRILMMENLSIVGFSVSLGAVVGLIVAYGNISAANSMSFGSSPLLRHLVFPVDSVLTLLACCAFVLGSTIIPVVVMSKRYLSEMERIVREI